MGRILFVMLLLLVLLGLTAPAAAQVPPAGQPPGGQAGNLPGQQPQPSAEPKERNTAFDHFMAFTGTALVLLVACYPSRRY